MGVHPVPVQFPALTFRFGQSQRCFSVQTAPPSPFCSHLAFCCLNCSTKATDSEYRKRMFILGMGFVGQFFASGLKSQGWIVSGTCTSSAKKKKFEEMGLDVHVFDANMPETEVLNNMYHDSHLLISIPPLVGIGDPILQYGDLLKSRLKGGNLQWLCYLSSTSIYGNCGGDWIDEDYPISPTSELAKARLAAEEGWLNLGYDLGLAAHVFRLGGIYGPGRSAVDTIIKQEHLSEGQRMRSSRHYTSRVHVADICQALTASIHKPSSRKIYNIVDDDPASRIEVFTFARKLVEEKWPGQIDQVPSDHGPEAYVPKLNSRDEKRVSNARMKKELGVKLLYPSYKSGLQSIIEHMDDKMVHF